MRATNCLTLTMAALLAAGWMTACQGSAEPKNANVNPPPATSATNANKTEAPAPVAEKPAEGSLATPTEAYKAAYAARQKKDVEALKRVMSKDALEFFALVAEDEKKTVDETLKQLTEKPQASTAETRNEKIVGDRATLEYLDEKGGWKTMDFIKEDGVWKLTIPDANSPGAEDMNKKP